MTRSRRLQPQEQELWDKVARNVRPLAKKGTRAKADVKLSEPAPLPKPVPKTKSQAPLKTQTPVLPPRHAGKGLPVTPSLEPALKRKLVRGRKPIEANLDLHGLTADKARAALARFIAKARAQDMRAILVITGKGQRKAQSTGQGLGQNEPGVLKKALPHWLSEMAEAVVAFEPAGPRHGGEGAYYVQLRARKRQIN